MSGKKKPYEKPELRGADTLQTGAVSEACCKTTGSVCAQTFPKSAKQSTAKDAS